MKSTFSKIFSVLILLIVIGCWEKLSAQHKGLTNMSESPYVKLRNVDIGDVHWTTGFWSERFKVCKKSMVPHMMNNYMDDSISHAFQNFEIAAGLADGKHIGPPFHDGDFYKMLEGKIMAYAYSKDKKLENEIDRIIAVIGKAQRDDGYIHTQISIKGKNNPTIKQEFTNREKFETYNMGHLMTAACIHYRVSGKTNLLNIARKATDYLYRFYKKSPEGLAQFAICPSHYMGIVEMYRATKDPKYLELAKGLVEIRNLVEKGTDQNQDRIPFKQQTNAIGQAVRANYLYAGVADVYAETGDDSLLIALKNIWKDLTEHKIYITGACGAVYDAVSPNGTTYNQKSMQKIHQAYGEDYELPNITAYNESCANIGNILWNWRMLQITGDAAFADIMETVMYNSLLAGVSLDGIRYFYTNPLCVVHELSDELRWSKNREPYLSRCNCCPPNTIRTIAEIQEYFYSKSKDGIYINFYGGNKLKTEIEGEPVEMEQLTNYPWDGKIKIAIQNYPKNKHLYLRIPAWVEKAELKINGKTEIITAIPGQYERISRSLQKGDMVELNIPMEADLIQSNPLVEENRNMVSVKRGPIVYCLESPDIPKESHIFDYKISADIHLEPVQISVDGVNLIALEGKLLQEIPQIRSNKLYRKISDTKLDSARVHLIPYFAWNNRGKSEMAVWIPYTQ